MNRSETNLGGLNWPRRGTPPVTTSQSTTPNCTWSTSQQAASLCHWKAGGRSQCSCSIDALLTGCHTKPECPACLEKRGEIVAGFGAGRIPSRCLLMACTPNLAAPVTCNRILRLSAFFLNPNFLREANRAGICIASAACHACQQTAHCHKS